MERPGEGAEHEPELFEGDGAQQGNVAGPAEDDRSSDLAEVKAETALSDVPFHKRPVREAEALSSYGDEAKGAPRLFGNEGVVGTAIHKEIETLFAAVGPKERPWPRRNADVRQCYPSPWSSSTSRRGDMGRSVKRRPVASAMALATAARGGTMGTSPTPRTP